MRRKFQASENSAWFQDAEGFAQCLRFVRHVANAESDGVEVDAIIFNRFQVFRVGFQEVHSAFPKIVKASKSFAPLGEHLRVDVRDRDMCFCVLVHSGGVVEDAECYISSPPSYVEYPLPFVRKEL